MLNLSELQVFVEAAQAQSFSVAARRLFLSQPAVSLQIRHLEQQLGVTLFERSGRSVTLSVAGKVLLPLARATLRSAKDIEETMWGVQGKVIGDLSIACSTTVGKYVLPRLVAGFRKAYPAVKVTISVMSRRAALEWLLDKRADVAVVSNELDHRELDFRRFLEDRIILIAPADHPWAACRAIAPHELTGTPFILREPTAGTYQIAAAGLAMHGLGMEDLEVVLTLANTEAIEMSVEAGIGCAFVSRLAASRGLALSKVVEVPIEGMALTCPIYMVRHRLRADAPTQKAFWEFAFDPANQAIRRLPEA